MVLERIAVGFMESNCYIFGDAKGIIVIDPGADCKKIKSYLDTASLRPKAIVNTHGHADHIGANAELGLPVWIHELDADFLAEPAKNLSGMFGFSIKMPPASRLLKDGDVFKVGDMDVEVIHTPGHTPGSICLKHKDIIFTGDTLFREGIGRTDFPYGSGGDIMESIKNKLLIHDGASIYPGHGPVSTIAWEKKNNPFLVQA